MELLCVPFCHSHVARHSNFAASGAAVSASRAPSSASTLTPLLTGDVVAVIRQLLAGVSRELVTRGVSKLLLCSRWLLGRSGRSLATRRAARDDDRGAGGVGSLRPRRPLPAVRRGPRAGRGASGHARRRARCLARGRLRGGTDRAQRSAALQGHARRAGDRRRGRGRGPPGTRRSRGTCSASTRRITAGSAASSRPPSRRAASKRSARGCRPSWTTSSTRSPRPDPDARVDLVACVRVPAAVHRHLRAARRARAGSGRPRDGGSPRCSSPPRPPPSTHGRRRRPTRSSRCSKPSSTPSRPTPATTS